MSIPTWLSVATYNRYSGSYFNGNVDASGNVIVRGTNSLWLDTNASMKLNGGTITTLSTSELATLDGITTGVSIQSQINGKATTTDVSTLIAKTQNQSATSSLTTFANGVTLTTGNLTLSNGDLSIIGTKSIICDGEFKLSSTGRISGTGLTISNAQLAYLNGLTASVEDRIVTLEGNTYAIDYNATSDTTDIISDIYLYQTGATSRKIFTSYQSITFDDAYQYINISNNANILGTLKSNYGGTAYDVGASIADLYNKTTSITYDSGTDFTNIDNNLGVTGYISSTGGLLAGSSIALTSTASTSNIILTSTATGGTYSTRQNAGDACILSSNPMIWVCSPSGAQTDAIRLTSTSLQIYTTIQAGGNSVSPISLGFLSGLNQNAESSLNALNTKTQNISVTSANTTFTGTQTLNCAVTLVNGRTMSCNGTATITLNGTAQINMASATSFITANGTTITPVEISYLDGATSNIQTAINSINTSITDLNTKTTAISYTPIPATTTISDTVNFTGTTKTTGTTWADGPIKLKTTYVAPASGELGYSVSATNATYISVTTNVVKGILQITLPLGVWIITYNCFLLYGSGTTTTRFNLGLNTTSSTTQATLAITTESGGSYIASKNYAMTQIQNVSTSTTFYLTIYALFSGGIFGIDGSYTSELKAVKIA